MSHSIISELGYSAGMKILLALFFLVSCASENKSLRELYPKNKAGESGVVVEALKASGLLPLKSGQTEIYRAENVSCLRELSVELWKCSFTHAGKAYEIPNIESSTLSGILMNLPVPQGDSGVATSFIECRIFDGLPENADCDIAISLDYPGP